jgi:hypothetical protein
VFERERLRCNACGQIFTAEEPANAGAEKYDATAIAMIALLKYGTGVPFKRLERLEGQLGMPLPAATQWELMEAAAGLLRPVLEGLMRQGAQGTVLHNDDTSMRVLRLVRDAATNAAGYSRAALSALRADGRSRYSSRDGNTRAKTSPRYYSAGRGNCRRRFRCAMHFRATHQSWKASKSCWGTASLTAGGSL